LQRTQIEHDLMPLSFGRGSACRLILAALALLALAALTLPPAARAASEAFTVRDLPIDAQAKSAADARSSAIAKGQRDAYQLMLDRVVLGGDAGRLPELKNEEVNALIEGFEIADEKVAPTRYRANLTVAFNEALVKAMLKEHGIQFVESTARPLVVVPILVQADGPRLWQDDNAWLHAWSVRDKPPGLTPIIVPLGDAADIAGLDIGDAGAGNVQPILQFARRYGAEEALVVEARPRGGVLSLSARHVTSGGVTSFTEEVRGTEGQTLPMLYAAAADRVVERLDAEVKSTAALRYGVQNTVRAVAPFGGLGEWVSLRAILSGLPVVQSIEIIALARTGADLVIHYYGDAAQLEAALAEHNLELTPNGPDGSFVLVPRPPGSAQVGSLSRRHQG